MQVGGGKCFVFFFHKGTAVLVLYLHMVLLLPVYIAVYTRIVPENEHMGVFGICGNILAKIFRIANSRIVPLPCMWQGGLSVSTILDGCQTLLLLVTQRGVCVKHEVFITAL